MLHNFAGRPTPLQFASRLTEHLGGARIYLKREDLLHTGAHKINNCIGQGLLAVRMGKKRVIAETGAGQHGVATATVAARLGLSCTVYMGTEDMERQRLNVIRMRLLGAEVIGVDSGSRTLKDAINEAMRDWVTNVRTTHYLLGLGAWRASVSADGARFSENYRRRSARSDSARRKAAAGLPVRVRGRRLEFDRAVSRIFGRCQREDGRRGSGRAREIAGGSRCAPGCGGWISAAHGRAFCRERTHTSCRRTDGQIATTHSISAGLDYAAVGPEHAWLADQGRAEYTAVTDDDAIEAARTLARIEGIIPALESAHAVAELISRAPKMKKDELVILNVSGRGDKDMETLSRYV